MKIECLKDKLAGAISKAEKVTGKNLTLPVLGCVYLEATGNNLKIKATNLDLGLEIDVPVKVEKEGIIAVPGGVLNNFISNLYNDKNIKLEVVGNNLHIKTEHSSTIIKSLPHEDFPTIPYLRDDKIFKINSQDFVKGLKSVWYSSGTSSMKPELSSVFVYTDEENLIFASTDSFRLAEKKIKLKKLREFNHVLIPFKNIPEIIRILDEVKDDVEMRTDKNQMAFSFNGIYLTSRIIDGAFPDYRQIIPKDHSTEVVALKQDLINSLKIANVFSDAFNKVNIKALPSKKLFEVMTKNSDVGENVNKIDAAITGDDIEINFNYKYITDCFQSIDSDSVSISFSGLSKPIIMRGVGDKSFTYLVMPMNK